jgi:protein-disulfide isomerase
MTTSVQKSLSKSTPSRNTLIVIAIIVIAVVAAIAAILLANNSPAVSTESYEGLPMSRLPDGGFVLGNPDAKVTIVEFADYACTHCNDYLPTMERFVNDFVKTGKAKFEYRIFPTEGRELTYFMGTIAVCLDEQRQGAFWEAINILFPMAASGQYNGNTGRALAEKLGLDYSKALACAQSQKQVDTDVALGNRVGVSGTPATLMRVNNGDLQWIEVGGQKWERGGAPYEVLAAAVTANQ